jgi:hypothetical protein
MLAMRRWIFLIAISLVACAETRPPLAPAEPRLIQPTEIAAIANALPSYTKFSISGLAFLDTRLFVSTNIGLLEVRALHAKHLYVWYEKFNVTSGPWSDQLRGAVWAYRNEDGFFVRLDRDGWHRVALPKPPERYYTRADFLEGFSAVGDATEFRLVGAGHVWELSNADEWSIYPSPPAEKYSRTVGFAEIEGRYLYVVRQGFCHLEPCNYAAYWRESEKWLAPIPFSSGRVKQVVSTSNGAFVRTAGGELLRIANNTVTVQNAPGLCEAISRASSGKLLASFRGVGVFVLEGSWVKLFDPPYPSSEGEHWAYLAEDNGTVALATTSISHFKSGTDHERYYTGTDALWMSQSGRLVRVELRQ